MLIKKYSKILIALCLCFPTFSQSFLSKMFIHENTPKKLYEQHSEISFGIGTANYYGDIVPIRRPIQSTLQNIRWNIALDFTRHFSPRFSGNVSLTWARIVGDDSKLEGVALQQRSFMRNAHFRNDLQELSFKGIFNLVPEGRNYHKRPTVIPYLFAGIAIIHHNPMAKVPLGYVGSEANPGEWVSLQPLHTEGQGLVGYSDTPYNLFAASIPLGVGVRYKLNKKLDLGFETGLRYSLTDYLDDIGGNYANISDLSAVNLLSVAMGHREYELIAANTGINREAAVRDYLATNINPTFNNPAATPVSIFPTIFNGSSPRNSGSRFSDFYILTSFRVVYHLSPNIKCPVIR
jgi:Domain of unknown function (DUF6089)